MRRTVVSGNRASVTLPNGQEAVAGGIVTQGAVTIEHSEVSDNVAEVEGAQAGDEDQVALAGGIKVGEDSDFPPPTAILRDSVVRGNRAVTRVEGAGTLAVAFAGGVLAGAPLLIERTRITDNLAHAISGGDAVADGGGLEIDSAVTIRDSIVARNVVAVDAAGAAGAVGGGIANAGDLTVERTTISGNRAHASGAGGLLPFGEASAALGGGIWNGSFGGPLPTLTVRDSAIVANALDAPAGFLVQGGGIYSAFPITLTRTALAGNRPDQCVGC